MKKFTREIVFFMTPILIIIAIFGGFYYVGYYSGEFKGINIIVQEQRENHSVIIGLGYNEQTAYYKLQNANYYQADIIALGTSRAMQFKSIYFDSSFYNCGGAVNGNYDEYTNFLENLKYVPDVILLDLDAWVFNDQWNKCCGNFKELKKIEQTNRNKLTMTKSIIQDFMKGKWTVEDLNNYSYNEGFNGKVRDNGYLYDGSLHYGDVSRKNDSKVVSRLQETYRRINAGNERFEYGTQIDEDTLIQLKDFLDYCSKKGIYVIGYLAPFAPSIYDMMVNSGNYDYLSQISPACKVLFKEFDYAYFDYSDGGILGVTDDYFVDGFHGSEVFYGMMVKDMSLQNTILYESLDNEKLSQLIDNAYGSILFENPDEKKY